jgi:hypothetical protein
MTEGVAFVRRNRVDERVALAIAAIAGVVAATAGAEPTGSATIDALLVTLSVAAVVWASASAPWWAPASASGLGAVIAFDPIVALVGAAGFVAGLVIGVRRRDQSALRAVVGAVALNVLIRSELDGFLGLSASSGSRSLVLFVVGVRRRRSSCGGGPGSVLAPSAPSSSSPSPVWPSRRSAPDPTWPVASGSPTQAISTLNDGDYSSRRRSVRRRIQRVPQRRPAPRRCARAPSRLVPAVAQNATAAASTSAAEAAGGTADAALPRCEPSTRRR